MRSISLNADLGEDPAAVKDGRQEALIALIDAANVACGGHAGDDDTVRVTVEQCRKHGVAVGAHPSYPDREGFGRTSLAIAVDDLARSLRSQLDALARHAAFVHVKPHGALYHDVARDFALAEVLREVIGEVAVVLPRGAATLSVFPRVIVEGFADRRYRPDGTLVPRTEPGALVLDPREAAVQAASLVGAVDTLCVHGDTPNALAIARAVRDALV